jgi:hypothetical protein
VERRVAGHLGRVRMTGLLSAEEEWISCWLSHNLRKPSLQRWPRSFKI